MQGIQNRICSQEGDIRFAAYCAFDSIIIMIISVIDQFSGKGGYKQGWEVSNTHSPPTIVWSDELTVYVLFVYSIHKLVVV